MYSKVLDLSQYDLDTMDAECMARSGVQGVILGVFSRSNAPEAMAQAATRLRAAGIPILGFYGLIYFGSAFGTYRDTRWAIDLAKRFGVERVWLDCEIDGVDVGFTDVSKVNAATRVRDIRNCVTLVERAGLKPGIYSAAWWWNPKAGGATEFSHLPLWYANYGPNNPLSPIPARMAVNFGGWTRAAIHQYSSTIPVCGRGRDHNYYELPIEGDDEMTPEEKARMAQLEDGMARLERIVGGWGNITVPVTKDNAVHVHLVQDAAKVARTPIGSVATFTGVQSLQYLDYRNSNMYLGLGNTQAKLFDLANAVRALGEDVGEVRDIDDILLRLREIEDDVDKLATGLIGAARAVVDTTDG